jgi:catechol 2,3-dioxygenase-like lactoylglutathione lyase family enzyme
VTTLKGVGLVYFFVSDMDRAVTFYRDMLGLPLLYRTGDDWAQFDAGPVQLGLHGSGQGEHRPGGTLAFRVDDLDSSRAALTARGLSFTPEGGGEGREPRFVEFLDPDGNVLGLLEYSEDGGRS